jgi:predicted ATPase/class 3 adenylate cyclase
LFSDIEGSTKLWDRFPDEMKVALATHDALMRQAIEAHKGYVFKTIGDAFCAAFETVTDALDAVIAAQRALIAEDWGEVGKIRARMALHSGIAQERDGDYFGPPVNRVARLLAAGHGGQVLLSLATVELLRDHMPEDTSLRDYGERRLKDLVRPEHIFQLLAPNLPSEFPPLKSLESFPNNLPVQLTSFVGREKEIAEVKRLLTATHLLTLMGTGGAGKTRLSLQVGSELLDVYPDGVWFIEFAPLTDATLVPQAIASAMGVREEHGRPMLSTLTDYLRDRTVLLIFDNCEHVVAACAKLAETLLRHCPKLRIMASSREALGIAGETVWRIPSLSLPDPKHLPLDTPNGLKSLTQYEAVRLFIDRATAVAPTFAVTNHNAPAVAQICYRLDGIPLALELAAARVKALTVEQIALRLDDRFRLLTGGSRTALPRQQTLRALVDWSYDLLTEQERAMWRRIGVFAGGWTLEAAEAICADGQIETYEVIDLLIQMVNKSLAIADDHLGETRYRMLETIRQYARDKLEASGEMAALRDKHLAFYQQLVMTAEPKLRGGEQVAWLNQLDSEHDNIRAALEWCLAKSDGETALQLASSLWYFWLVRGYQTEGRERLNHALGLSKGQTALRAKALNALGFLVYFQDDYPLARTLLNEALAMGRALDAQPAIAYALYGLGCMAWTQGDYSLARTRLEESITLFRASSDVWGTASALTYLGDTLNHLNECELGIKLHEESLALARSIGDKGGQAFALYGLASLKWTQYADHASETLFEEALALYRALGDRPGIARTLDRLAVLEWHEHQYDKARKLFEECLLLDRDLGNRDGIAHALEGMAGLAVWQKQSERAARLFGAAEALRESISAPIPPAEQDDYARSLAPLRAQLPEMTLQAAWAEGRQMTAEQAIVYALSA